MKLEDAVAVLKKRREDTDGTGGEEKKLCDAIDVVVEWLEITEQV